LDHIFVTDPPAVSHFTKLTQVGRKDNYR